MDDWTAWTSHVALLLRRPIKEAGCAFSNDPQTYGKGSKKKRGESRHGSQRRRKLPELRRDRDSGLRADPPPRDGLFKE